MVKTNPCNTKSCSLPFNLCISYFLFFSIKLLPLRSHLAQVCSFFYDLMVWTHFYVSLFILYLPVQEKQVFVQIFIIILACWTYFSHFFWPFIYCFVTFFFWSLFDTVLPLFCWWRGFVLSQLVAILAMSSVGGGIVPKFATFKHMFCVYSKYMWQNMCN